jgi:hypothetical protein
MTAKVLASLGIVATAFGAVLVAIEVIRVFHGERFKPNTWEREHVASDRWRHYEAMRLRGMRSGLTLILIGSALQLVAIWY